MVEALKAAQKNVQPKDLTKDKEGLWRANGRLDCTDLPTDVKHPAVINGDSSISRLLVLTAHEKAGLPGRRYLSNYIHTKFGIKITNSRHLLESIKKNCKICREFHGKHHSPIMGNLPKERALVGQSPFIAIGIDFAGDLTVEGKQTPGQVVLYTCLTTRVIHLELAESKSTGHFLARWKRFIYRRGVTLHYVLTDWAKSFIQARSIISKEINSNPVNAGREPFKWEIAVPRAPHQRGSIEIAVKHFKSVLSKTLKGKETKLTESDWNTILAELTYIINKRPHLDDKETCNATAFTGNSLLHPYVAGTEEPQTTKILRNAHKLTRYFWEPWYETKPAELFERQK